MNSVQSVVRLTAALTCIIAASPAYSQHEGHQMPVPATAQVPAAPPPARNPLPQAAAGSAMPASGGGSPQGGHEGMSAPVSDNMTFHQVLVDELEYGRSRGRGSVSWDAQAWIGKDFGKLWLKTEGERVGGATEDARVEVLWSKPVAAFWDLQAGVRHDFGAGPSRNWLGVGVQGVAPYWFDVEAFAYVGTSGRLAARAKAEYQFVLTQRLFLVPSAEANLYSRSDAGRGIGSGLSDAELGVRLRYEFRREFAPYVGVSWGRKFGETATLARRAGEEVTNRRLLAGVRFWF